MVVRIAPNRTYFGNEDSLEGWETSIGHFRILDANEDFRRYMAHESVSEDDLQRYSAEIAKLAHEYGMSATGVLRSHGTFYHFKKYANIFFLGDEPSESSEYVVIQPHKNLYTIQRTLEDAKVDKRILFSVEVPREEKPSTVVIDINEKLKDSHLEIIGSLDEILFSKH